MKVVTIGRGDDNQIVLEDNQDMISRQHATLRIYETGKMEIISTGSNGTFVNGFRIKSNMPYKVTRKDVISFAHVRQLDWALIPDSFRLIRYGIISIVAVVLVAISMILLWPKKKIVIPETPVIIAPVNNEPSLPKEETPRGEPKPSTEEGESEKGKVTPAKRFPSKDKEKKKEKEDKEKDGKAKAAEKEESNPLNQVF